MHIRDYIQATYETFQKENSVSDVLTNLQIVLKKRGLEKFYPRILRGLIDRINRSEHSNQTTVTLARESDLNKYQHEIDEARTSLQITGEHTIHIDPSIIGGFVVKGKSEQINASYKKSLLQAYQRLQG